jgi:hypothetical protein
MSQFGEVFVTTATGRMDMDQKMKEPQALAGGSSQKSL